MIFNYENVNDIDRYKLISGTVIPRPIAWIVTEDNGILNAAPFSYFIPLSSNPAIVIVSIGEKNEGVPKDTLANILKTKKATICFANETNLPHVKLSSTPLAKELSEIVEYDIEIKKELNDFPPMINSSQSALFCEYYSTVKIPGQTTPIILEVKHQYLDEKCVDEHFHVNLDNVGRSGAFFSKMIKI